MEQAPATSRSLPPMVIIPILLAGCACLPSCGQAPDARLSSVLITLDTTRADALPSYGNTAGRMPHLDAFAEQSVQYEYAHTVAPLTLPSHASMLTGLYPVRHSVRINGPRPLPEQATTLAEMAGQAGFQTAAFVSASVLNAPMGLSQGFDHFGGVEGERPAAFHELERPAGDVVDEAIAWLDARDTKRPFFIWLHLFDPHAPHEPDASSKGLTPSAYLDELAYVDTQLGRFFAEMAKGQLDEHTVVIICADHGEGFGEHGEDNHGWLTYESVLRVPFLLRYADGTRAGEHTQELVSLVDVTPTLACAMGIPLPLDLDGISLYKQHVDDQRGIYFEAYQGYEAQRWSPVNGWMTREGKYIYSSSPEWYSPRIDPKEKYNLIKGQDVESYRNAILNVASKHRIQPSDAKVSDAQMVDIQALGYAASVESDGEFPELLADTGLPIPREMIQDERLLRKAMLLQSQRQFKAARPILLAILERNPSNSVAAEVLGYGYNSDGMYAEAEQVLRELVRRGVHWPNVLFLLGHAQQKQGREQAARASYEAALEEDPEWKPALEALSKMP